MELKDLNWLKRNLLDETVAAIGFHRRSLKVSDLSKQLTLSLKSNQKLGSKLTEDFSIRMEDLRINLISWTHRSSKIHCMNR